MIAARSPTNMTGVWQRAGTLLQHVNGQNTASGKDARYTTFTYLYSTI